MAMSKNIKWVLGHLGGAVPYLAERLGVDGGKVRLEPCQLTLNGAPLNAKAEQLDAAASEGERQEAGT